MDNILGIGVPELILILLIAGIVMGPERIGVVARWLGKTTAQLQAISRGFIKQLNSELDGIQDASEIRGAMQDMKDLRGQIEELKQELMSVSSGAVGDSKSTLAQVQDEVERSIAPPSITSKTSTKPGGKKVDATSVESTAVESTPVEPLPNRLEVPDDPGL